MVMLVVLGAGLVLAIAGGGIGYAALYRLSGVPRVIGSCIAACLPGLVVAGLAGAGSWTEAARQAFLSGRTIATVAAWLAALGSYAIVAKRRGRAAHRG
jgi:hypothetical protein